MVALPKHLQLPTTAQRLAVKLSHSLNFYRIHVIAFTFIPLIISGIMYAVSTEYSIAYIDCLFCCFSAMTVTGLATIDLSKLSPFQQFLLFFQMIIGSTTFVSIIMVVVRRHFFRQKFRHVVQERDKRRGSFSLSKSLSVLPAAQPISAIRRRFSTALRSSHTHEADAATQSNAPQGQPRASTPSTVEMKAMNSGTSPFRLNNHKKKKGPAKFSKDMIKRIDGGGVGLVNPMGWYDAERANATPPPGAAPASSSNSGSAEGSTPKEHEVPEIAIGTPSIQSYEPPLDTLHSRTSSDETEAVDERRMASDAALNPAEDGDGLRPIFSDTPQITERPITEEPEEGDIHLKPKPYAGRPALDDAFPRSKTIAFDDAEDGLVHELHLPGGREEGFFPRTATGRSYGEGRMPRTGTTSSFPRTYSLRPSVSRRVDTKLSGFGGFPTPFEVGGRLFSRFFPKTSRTLTKSVTMPRTNTISGRGSVSDDLGAKEVPYISFSAVVGRNSRFQGLTEEQMDELGGVEYRALKALVWIVITYFVFVQLAGFVIMAPYISAGGRYDSVFDNQYRVVAIPWFALFQSVSGFSNTGMSLVDESMLPFQTAYLMIVVLIFLILAGNTAFPIFLRFSIWSLYKIVPARSSISETLKFLLDHPRRCFIYLFPSTQTRVLLCVMVALTLVDWVSFLVLDIGTSAIESIPIGTRIAAGFLQSSAVRAAGFAIVPLNSLAPAVKVLYVIMMYISVYPIALSVRSTNVYEERSLGLYEEDIDEDIEPEDTGPHAVAKYLGWHARRQLAFDIWWLGFALWLVCIIERGALDNPANYEWMNIFNIIFELVSAYGTVGLSLGVPYDDYSLSGSFRTLSKLVVIAVMLRGRHRGLPVAIDRAVMLPRDFTATEEEEFEERARRSSRRASSLGDGFLPNTGPGFQRSFTQRSNVPDELSPISPVLRATGSGNQTVTIAPGSPRRGSSPSLRGASSSSAGRRHSRSYSNSEDPSLFHFTLPSAIGPFDDAGPPHQHSLSHPPSAGHSQFTRMSGALTPVRESTMSRRQTLAAEAEVEL